MFTEDLSEFLDTDEHATAGTVDGDTVNAIFSTEWSEVTIAGVPYSGVLPKLEGKYSDFSGKDGTTAVFSGTNYTIVDIRPDGTGWCEVILMEQ